MAGFLRFSALDHYPLPIHQDELSDIYDGYSLATTGADRWGEPWPMIVRGMGPGDYHPGMYAYCAAISTKLFGFSVWSGRLPAAIAGILTVFLVYLTSRRILSRRASIITLLLIAFSPIHVLYSRQAHQGVCMVPLVVMLSLYLMVRLLDSLRAPRELERGVAGEVGGTVGIGVGVGVGWAIACGLAIGLSTNAYAAMRLIAPLLAITIAGAVFLTEGISKRDWKRTATIVGILTIFTAIGASTQLYVAFSEPEHFFARSNATTYALSNGPRWWVTTLNANLWRELNPHYLFLSFGEYRILSIARLSIVELPFLYVGLIASIVLAIRRRSMTLALVPVAVLICLLPSMATRGDPSPMRSSGVWAIYPIASSLGISLVGRLFMDRFALLRRVRIRQLAFASTCVIVLASGLFNTQRYLRDKTLHGPAAQNNLVTIGRALADENLENYERVYIDADGMFPYLYAAAFSGMTPNEFQKLPRKGTLRGLGWDEFETLGRFHFKTIEQAKDDRRAATTNGRWLVVSCDGVVVKKRELTAVHIAQSGS